MNVEAYLNLDSLYSALRQLEAKWGKDNDERYPSDRFQGLTRRAYEQIGREAVVLVRGRHSVLDAVTIKLYLKLGN